MNRSWMIVLLLTIASGIVRAADSARRKAFAEDCRRVVRTFKLDGIDIDWEYPTQSSAGISSSPTDTRNFKLLMHNLRQSLGDDHNWPPQPALVEVETQQHAITRTLPKEFVAPASEFYQFSPSPRANKHVEVLVSISPKNYPFGLKDIVTHGDFPILSLQQGRRDR